jgi:hypothetical protein
MPTTVAQAMRNIPEDFSTGRCEETGFVVGSPACKDCKFFSQINVERLVVICNYEQGKARAGKR